MVVPVIDWVMLDVARMQPFDVLRTGFAKSGGIIPDYIAFHPGYAG